MELNAPPPRDIEAILSELRDRIDREHGQALQAHARLARYLRDADGANVPDEMSRAAVKSCLHQIIGHAGHGRSNRDLVFHAISAEPRSIDQICELTSLSKKQVQGVVYAPETKDRIKRDNSHAPPTFNLRANTKAK